ncbi:hypothetical protein BH11BAC2_BH11BAC2_23860 [soil metagenome]
MKNHASVLSKNYSQIYGKVYLPNTLNINYSFRYFYKKIIKIFSIKVSLNKKSSSFTNYFEILISTRLEKDLAPTLSTATTYISAFFSKFSNSKLKGEI